MQSFVISKSQGLCEFEVVVSTLPLQHRLYVFEVDILSNIETSSHYITNLTSQCWHWEFALSLTWRIQRCSSLINTTCIVNFQLRLVSNFGSTLEQSFDTMASTLLPDMLCNKVYNLSTTFAGMMLFVFPT